MRAHRYKRMKRLSAARHCTLLWGDALSRSVRILLTLFGAIAAVTPASGQRGALAMLDGLEGGRWEVRLRDGTGRAYPLCVQHGRALIQLRHERLACDRLVIDDRPGEVTVQYTCRGKGYGRTHIRRETNRLVQIDTQGIAEGLPFDFTAEARRVGDCAG